ncbi:putative unusual protein kinase regulating ubiquinone biosynthesis (AarF/ABC1/UbiB family) [Roseivirga ehrenbergii]|uniref:ABC1 kinase family protein n=1 Tax=Roseivirga ehrenbergii (strain DSM 102268 / JCM 13514 / KCTC 12282 / NCIMB 14502 / KMM 6017) TaxID=279360 RepID=UPI000A0229B1|nr:AarF/UbiB family protein [Roseivirga ehrenbergii]TCL13849.1 putative unusual protein kinase regulating ubiquinone biosynthesis (AarF/ABC1/UbiB family) [Roseivirga ehrenbergii]
MSNLAQYKDIALFLIKYGNSDIIKESGLATEFSIEEEKNATNDLDKEAFIKDFQKLGSTYVKLGQLLSTRPDLISEPYLSALRELQDNMEPFSYEEVEQLVQNELRVRISKAFNSFDQKPIGAASLGQVHLAELRNGTTVVVKIQRPGIRKKVIEELEAMESVSSFLENNTSLGKKYNLNQVFLQFKSTLLRELNYLKEAQNMDILHNNLKEFDRIVIPTSIPDYSTDKVLTMEFVKGQNISQINPLRKLDIDGEGLCEELFKAYLQQIVVDGFMHADPHPGNVHLTEDNRLALLDMGMVTYISEDLRKNYLKLILNISNNKVSEALNVLIEMSTASDEADEEQFKTSIAAIIQQTHEATVDQIDTGRMMFGLIQTAAECGYKLPLELSAVGKALMNIDLVAHTLAPDFEPNKSIQKNAMSLMNKIMIKELAPQNFFSTILESKELIEKMPQRLNTIMGNLANNELEIKLDAIDEKSLMKGFQKVANRITIGLIIAALLVASALMMKVETSFSLFGYPGIAMLSFILAITGGLSLVIGIFFKDEN